MTWRAAAAARIVADDVLWAFGLELVTKSSSSPLTNRGFDELVRALVLSLESVTSGARNAGLSAALAQLETRWRTLTEVERQRVIAASMERYLGAAARAAPATVDVFTQHARTAISRTRNAASQKHQLKLPFSNEDPFEATDRRVINHVGTQSHYIRTSSGRISQRLSQVARDVVARGLEAGHDDRTIGKELAKELRGSEARQSRAYLEVVSSIFVARSRSYGLLRSFQDAGLSMYELRAVLDEVTTDTCRLMHGKRFSVGAAIDRYAEVASRADPEDVVDLQPFIRQGRLPNGERVLFTKTRGGEREIIAHVQRSGVGRREDQGEFRQRVPDAAFERRGCCAPPFHGHCRTTMVPVFGGARAQVPATFPTPAIAAPAAPAPTPTALPPPPPPIAGPDPDSLVTVQPAVVGAPGVPVPPPPSAAAAKPPRKPRKPGTKPRARKPPPAPPPPPTPPVQPPAPPSVAATPPAPKFQPGVHALALKSNIAKADLAALLERLSKDVPGVLDFLKRVPLTELVINRAIKDRGANGTYSWGSRRILNLRWARKPTSWGGPLIPGSTFSISSAAKSREDAVFRTLIHELGHHIHLHDSPSRSVDFLQIDVDIRTVALRHAVGSTVTRYGGPRDYREYWAEVFAAYVFARAELILFDPAGFALVQRVLAARQVVL